MSNVHLYFRIWLALTCFVLCPPSPLSLLCAQEIFWEKMPLLLHVCLTWMLSYFTLPLTLALYFCFHGMGMYAGFTTWYLQLCNTAKCVCCFSLFAIKHPQGLASYFCCYVSLCACLRDFATCAPSTSRSQVQSKLRWSHLDMGEMQVHSCT